MKYINYILFILITSLSYSQDSIQEQKKATIEQTREYIIKQINLHGFEEDSFKRRCRATFEGDYLRIVVMNKKNTKPVNGGILYDFSNVYKFQKVSQRSRGRSFINIWVSILKNKKRNIWDKHKMIMRVDNYAVAKSIVKALKHYNKLLLDKEEKELGDLKF